MGRPIVTQDGVAEDGRLQFFYPHAPVAQLDRAPAF